MADSLGPFDPDLIESVAAESEVDADALATLLSRQQRLVSEFPDLSVAGLVHDWRMSLREDPLVETAGAAFYLDVPEHVWTDLASRMELTAEEDAALRALQAAQFEAVVGRPATDVAVVLRK